MLQSDCWISSIKYKVRWKGFCCGRNLYVLGDMRLSRVLRAATVENVPDRVLRLSPVLRPATLGCEHSRSQRIWPAKPELAHHCADFLLCRCQAFGRSICCGHWYGGD